MISTERILLIPLTYKQVVKFKNLNNELEDELGLHESNRTINDHFKNAIEKYTLKWIEEDPDNYLFATIWIIIDKTENVIVGDIGFKRKPNEFGVIEIGYATQPRYQRKGYMTEAIKEMVDWAFKHNEARSILAETKEDNEGSIKSLIRNGFTEYKQIDNMIWWQIEKSDRLNGRK